MGTVSASYLKSVVDTAVQHKVPSGELNACIPGGLETLTLPEGRYPNRVLAEVLDLSAKLSGGPAFGIRVGAAFRSSTFLDVGYALSLCSTMREAMAVNARYQPLTQQLGQTAVEEAGEECHLTWTPVDTVYGRHRRVVEAVFAGYATIGRWMLWQYPHPIAAMHFCHEPPRADALAVYESLFQCPLVFGAQTDHMIFDPALLDQPLPSANPELLALLCDRLDGQLRGLLDGESLRQRVLRSIQRQMETGAPSLTESARHVGMSERTLRRHLAEDALTYRQLLEEARRDSCEVLMRDVRLSPSDIGDRLGYKDQSAFSRAFRRWHGTSPVAFRRSLT